MGIYGLVTGKAGKSGFGSGSTAEDVTNSINANHLTAIITGGTSGIGLEAARVLAMRGAHVIIAARNPKAANDSKEMILQMNPNARIDYLQLDLSSIKSVRSFVDQFLALNVPLNILINNAGVMFCPFQLTEDGIESQFATNHIGHFLLTNLLLEKMKSTARESGIEGRIVNLSSIAHTYTYPEGIKFQSINDPDEYSDKKAYGQSKLSNLLHSNALSRKLKEEGVNITVNSVHPGLVTTNLFRYSGFGMKVFKAMTFLLWKNIPQGAATTCYVALHPDLKGVTGSGGRRADFSWRHNKFCEMRSADPILVHLRPPLVTGKYFSDCNFKSPSKFATDDSLADKLWDFSVKLIDSLPTKNNP